MKNKTKKRIVFTTLGVLSAAAVTLVTMAVVTALKKPEAVSDTPDNSVEAVFSMFPAEVEPSDIGANIDLEGELEPQINEIVTDIKERCGGEWSVCVYIPSTESRLSLNEKKLQAASVIKLFIMGAVYDEYDELVKYYQWDDVPDLIESMITISDNDAADLLVMMLGRGDAAAGRRKVNDYCKKLGLKNTSMDRMMGDDNIFSDNYTSTGDTADFLAKVLSGEFDHSKDMLKLLEAQTRTTKIPEGVPKNVMTANKTGELDDVENDAAIIFAARPYILCVMSDGVNDYQPPIDAITDISTVTYNYIAPKLVPEETNNN